MTAMPHMMKVCSLLCTPLFGLSLVLTPATPAWALEDNSSMKGAELVEKAGATVMNEAVGEKEKPAVAPSKKPLVVASGGNIQLNTPCVGVTSTNEYFGLWKRLGSTKAKCKEGATGQPGAHITRLTCRIVTLNDGNFDNALVAAPDSCIK